ncbi:hypothetical protein QJQ45_009149 [Haematococcus lacustris]|nr:hypothetical protein QJQ45_009149 [Haematococcus lacustris]
MPPGMLLGTLPAELAFWNASRHASWNGWETKRRQVIKVLYGAVLHGCKKTKRKLLAHLQLRAEVHCHLRLLRPALSQQRDQPVRGLMWCPAVAPRKPPQASCSSQEATPTAASEPGPSTPPPAKRSKRTKAEQAAEPTHPTEGNGKGQGKAAKAKPAPQPGRWLDRDCNAALNMQRIGESSLCPSLAHLPRPCPGQSSHPSCHTGLARRTPAWHDATSSHTPCRCVREQEVCWAMRQD